MFHIFRVIAIQKLSKTVVKERSNWANHNLVIKCDGRVSDSHQLNIFMDVFQLGLLLKDWYFRLECIFFLMNLATSTHSYVIMTTESLRMYEVTRKNDFLLQKPRKGKSELIRGYEVATFQEPFWWWNIHLKSQGVQKLFLVREKVEERSKRCTNFASSLYWQ